MNDKPEPLEEFVPENLRRSSQPLPKSKPANLGLLVVLLIVTLGSIAAGSVAIFSPWVASGVQMIWAPFGGLAMLVVGVLLYFLPCFVAGSQHRNRAAIFIINLLLGWTLVGWVVALVWALYREKGTA
jgi:hypothetical protein